MSLEARVSERVRDVANRLVRSDPVMRQSFRQAERILVTTAESAKLVPERFRDKCEVQLGVGLSRSYLGWTGPGQRRREGTLKLLYAGRLLEWKGVDLGLRALKSARECGAKVDLTIVGSGPAEPGLRRLAAEFAIEDAVRWLKWLPQIELLDQYRRHDVFLFPSLRDSGGMALLEAMAHGLPVVCTNCGGPGVIVNESCGRVVATGGRRAEDVAEDLTEALVTLSANRGLLGRLGRGARERAWEFDFRKMVTQVHPLVEADAPAVAAWSEMR
jgi:glycosyltransferase involved in cell wall biosynthesis